MILLYDYWLIALQNTTIPRYLANRDVVTDLLHFVYRFSVSEHFHEKDTLWFVSLSSKTSSEQQFTYLYL